MASSSSIVALFFMCFLLVTNLSISSSNLLSRRGLKSSSTEVEAEAEEDVFNSLPTPKKKASSINKLKNNTSSTTSLRPLKSKDLNSSTSSLNKFKLPKSKDTNFTTNSLIKTKKDLNFATSFNKTKLPKSKDLNFTTTSLSKIKLPKPKDSNFTTSLSKIKLPKSKDSIFNSTMSKTKLPKSKDSIFSTTMNKTKLPKSKDSIFDTTTTSTKPKKKITTKLDPTMSWLNEEQEDEEDNGSNGPHLIAEFRGLPSRLLPDLAKISATSKVYISKANKDLTASFKPYIGPKHASAAAAVAGALLLSVPFLLLLFLARKLKNDNAIIGMHIYLAIYFGSLSFIGLVTGLEPLKFFYAASPKAYAFSQVIQSVIYIGFIIVQLLNLLKSPAALVGILGSSAVGVHYYVAVVHRAIVRESPRVSWRSHGTYAICFVGVSVCMRAAGRRKKLYLDNNGGEGDGKKS